MTTQNNVILINPKTNMASLTSTDQAKHGNVHSPKKGKVGHTNWDGGKLWHHWFIKGHYFSDCKQAPIHVAKFKISTAMIQALATLMKEVHGN